MSANDLYLYPYPKDEDRHPYAWVFFNVPGAARDGLDAADRKARHVFDDLGCSPPGSAHPARIKYDGLGGSGAPYENGAWIKVEDERAAVTTTAPAVDVTSMTSDERAEYLAEVEAAVRMAEIADHAGTNRHSDQTTEG